MVAYVVVFRERTIDRTQIGDYLSRAKAISDEHGKLKVGPKAKPVRMGEKVWLIPGHCDPTVNLHDWYVGVRNGRVEALWPVSARGAST